MNPTQEPDPAPQIVWLEQLQSLGWVDLTALSVLLVFFVLGLFKGLIWQVSRIGILVAAYVVAGRFGHDVAAWFARDPVADGNAAGGPEPGETTLYLAYVLLFLAVLVLLSLLTLLVKKLADKAGLGFFDRLGGGLLGLATGACVVLAGVFVLHMFFAGRPIAQAADASHSLRLSRQAIDWLGTAVPNDLRRVLSLRPLLRDGGATDVDGETPMRGDTGPDGEPVPAPPFEPLPGDGRTPPPTRSRGVR